MSTKVAGKTEWVEVDGIRRLVVEGQPLPVGVGVEDQAKGDEIDPNTLTRPVVDEEGAKSYHERAGTEPPDARGGISTENVEKVGAATRRRQARSGGGSGSGGGGGSES